MQLTTSPSRSSSAPSNANAIFLFGAIVAAVASASVLSAEAFMSGASLVAHSSRTTTSQQRSSRGGNDYDYSGGNLKYGTGKFTQRESAGGVNLSKNGRSMQDSVYREDRHNVDRARGQPRDFESFGSRMDEVEDLERGMGRGGGRGGPREGLRDRMMRGGSGRGMDLHEMDEFGDGPGIRDRMGGGGLLRDMQDSGGRGRESYDEFGSPPKVMGGSSRGRGGGYRSNQFENSISNERRRFEEYGHRMSEYGDDEYSRGNGIIDFESTGSRGGGRRMGGGGSSNFDRLMGRGGGRGGGRDYDEYEGGGGDYEMEDYQRGGGGSRGMEHREDYRGDGGGRGGGGGGLLRDMHR